ncbi:uncharacterized protein LOC21407255 isoform X2 [Morus notabilis]|uniref:uncharacterized protein LOC21407255 isoform X2 n=1 Tax=Morus notabilis TaxID=981085 RepID=UPI000CED0372|nr:uncharacterized protein LOC21407255 isoform X2 [Morus notabilis]
MALANPLLRCPNPKLHFCRRNLPPNPSLSTFPPTFLSYIFSRKIFSAPFINQISIKTGNLSNLICCVIDCDFSKYMNSISLLKITRFPRTLRGNGRVICAAASAAGSSSPGSDSNPYEVLGVSPIEGFDSIKVKYARKRKEAERAGDEATAARLEKAYDKIMMAQLQNRKKGVTFGSFKVSKDVKYADKQPIVPWGPRFTKSSVQDMRINLAIAAAFTVWILFKQNADYKPLQFLSFAFVYRLFEKLKSFEPPVTPTYTEDGEDSGRGLRMGKRLLRALSLVFGCIAAASLAYTGILNLIELMGGFIPAFLYNNQATVIEHSSIRRPFK